MTLSIERELGVADEPVAHAPAPVRRHGFVHQPALDGVRGLSVLLVLLYHGGWSWMPGGYVGVSVFFTLSGFLITRLLLQEHASNGRINVVRFWGRRMRRLLPASMLCLVAVAVFGTAGAFGDVPTLGHDLAGALFQVANWFQLAGDTTYSMQVLGLRSPLDHYWSLAIEEQFYWVWPLVMVAVLRRTRPGRAVMLMTLAACAAAPLIALRWGADAAYWATPARIAEILVGAALAFALQHRHQRPPRWTAWLGWPAVVVIVWAATRWSSATGPAYAGWFPIFALASAALILALQVPSPLRRAFSLRPLVALGAVSYGVYLFHWPIFLLLHGRFGGGHLVEFSVAVAVTLLVATVSYRVLERPIRFGAGSPRVLAPALAVSAVAVLLLTGFGSFGEPDRFAEPDSAVSQLEPVDSLAPLAPVEPAPTTPATTSLPQLFRPDTMRPPVTTPVTTPAAGTPANTAAPGVVPDVTVAVVPSRPVRILVVGDSTAWSLGDGLAAWAAAHPDLASVTLNVSPGCGFILHGHVPVDAGSGYEANCGRLLSDTMMASLRDLQPDVVLLMAARSDVKDRQWDDAEGPISNLDPRFQDRQRSDYRDITDWVLGAGTAKVVWVKPLVVRPDPAPADELTHPEQLAALHAVIDATVAGSAPGRVASIDLAGWYATAGLDDLTSRIDGIHFEVPAATEIATRLVGPSLVNVAVG